MKEDEIDACGSVKLMVVMPAYQEEACVERVLGDWLPVLAETEPHFLLLAIDDGSRDRTYDYLQKIAERWPGRMEVRRRENRGHGQTCMEGYREARDRGVPWVFQMDSDGQCDPRYFADFWGMRESYDVIYGVRDRGDGWVRQIASRLLRTLLCLFEGVRCEDPNVPYRLMRLSACGVELDRIPRDFDLANVALAVVLRRRLDLRHGAVPIHFGERIGGEPSVPLRRFAIKAWQMFGQLKRMRKGTGRHG